VARASTGQSALSAMAVNASQAPRRRIIAMSQGMGRQRL
jgi:hypothetical protein